MPDHQQPMTEGVAAAALRPGGGHVRVLCRKCNGLGWVPEGDLQVGCDRCNGDGEEPGR